MTTARRKTETKIKRNWMEFAENYWTAEMSDVSANNTKQVKCPRCHAPVNALPSTRLSGKIVKWEGRHGCGAMLLLWN